MATRRKRKKPVRRKPSGGKSAGFGQKLAVALALIVLVLCAASATFSFFVRNWTDGRETGTFTIEVLNGTGKAGLAHEAKRGLLHRGIDVIAVENAEHFDYPESVLISRKRGADVEMLGEILGCKNVIVQIREDSIEDATLILGADYRDLNLEWDGD
jgi:hypothetical protein